MRAIISICLLLAAFGLKGCAIYQGELLFEAEDAKLAPRSASYQELIMLPEPRGKVVASVYSFRDQTGQYKPVPASNFSTAVTQGATAMLVQALNDSGWFITLERDGLQNLLTERKIIRAAQKKQNAAHNSLAELPSLLAANVLFEGGIIAYDSNVRTGGTGARYLGVGGSERYSVDQVTVNLRAIDVRTGQILQNISTSKTILSQEVQTGVFRFIEFRELLEMEAGMTTNEPAQLCVQAAIETAVLHMIARGIERGIWLPRKTTALENPTLQRLIKATPEV